MLNKKSTRPNALLPDTNTSFEPDTWDTNNLQDSKGETQMTEQVESTDPKQLAGAKKASAFQYLPVPVMMELGMAMAEGAEKYGAFNWRKDRIKNSVYIDAVGRHLAAFMEGEDIDADSGLSHVTKLISCLTVLRDAMINGSWVDDRPPSNRGFNMEDVNAQYRDIVAQRTERR